MIPTCRLMSFNNAKDNGIVMLSFPPHCSRKLQPLDSTVYGPLKRYYNATCDGCIVSNKGRTMSIYDIPAMVGIALSRTMSPGNILSGFKVSGVFPFDRHTYSVTASSCHPMSPTGKILESQALLFQRSTKFSPLVMTHPSSTPYLPVMNMSPVAL